MHYILTVPDSLTDAPRIWYAAFGSNLSQRRFLTYLQGGRPPLGDADHREEGARDASLPTGSLPFAVDNELYFAYRSTRWGGGGVAFLDADVADPEAGPTLCRTWCISVGQFEDVHRQENRAEMAQPLNMERLVDRGRVLQYDGLYGLALLVGFHEDGLPVVTITSSRRVPEPNVPDLRYLMTIGTGLHQSMGMDREEIIDYLITKDGVRGVYTREGLLDALTGAALLREES